MDLIGDRGARLRLNFRQLQKIAHSCSVDIKGILAY